MELFFWGSNPAFSFWTLSGSLGGKKLVQRVWISHTILCHYDVKSAESSYDSTIANCVTCNITLNSRHPLLQFLHPNCMQTIISHITVGINNLTLD